MQALDDPCLRPVHGRPGELEPIPRIPGNIEMWGEALVKSIPGNIEMWGEALVKNGDTEFRARNKIVGQGLRHLINNGLFRNYNSDAGLTMGSGASVGSPPFNTNDLTRSRIRVGTGSGNTTDATTALTSEDTTNPDSTATSRDNPSTGVYRFKFTATWNAGTLTAITVSEIGIFGQLLYTAMTSGAQTGSGMTVEPAAMFARLSAADSEFTSFAVNTSVPLVIEYRIVMTFT